MAADDCTPFRSTRLSCSWSCVTRTNVGFFIEDAAELGPGRELLPPLLLALPEW